MFMVHFLVMIYLDKYKTSQLLELNAYKLKDGA